MEGSVRCSEAPELRYSREEADAELVRQNRQRLLVDYGAPLLMGWMVAMTIIGLVNFVLCPPASFCTEY